MRINEPNIHALFRVFPLSLHRCASFQWILFLFCFLCKGPTGQAFWLLPVSVYLYIIMDWMWLTHAEAHYLAMDYNLYYISSCLQRTLVKHLYLFAQTANHCCHWLNNLSVSVVGFTMILKTFIYLHFIFKCTHLCILGFLFFCVCA